jgi:hypothetical protein
MSPIFENTINIMEYVESEGTEILGLNKLRRTKTIFQVGNHIHRSSARMLDMANKEQRLGNDGVRWLG